MADPLEKPFMNSRAHPRVIRPPVQCSEKPPNYRLCDGQLIPRVAKIDLTAANDLTRIIGYDILVERSIKSEHA